MGRATAHERKGSGAGAGAPPASPPAGFSPPPSSTGNIVGGVFLIGCGLCLALVGGGCTALLVAVMADTHSRANGSELAMPVTILVVGIGAVILGIRLATRRSGT